MKATLEFELPEEKSELRLALSGVTMICAICDADRVLRAFEKYSDGTIEEAEKAIESAREILCDVQGRIDVE